MAVRSLRLWQSIDLDAIRAGDKRLQKAIKKAEKRTLPDSPPLRVRSDLGTTDLHSESESDGGSDTSEDESEPTLEEHTIFTVSLVPCDDAIAASKGSY